MQGIKTTPEQLAKVVAKVREGYSLADAAESAGTSRYTVAEYKRKDPEFAKAMEEAYEASLDTLESHAYCRAKDGDNDLLKFLLKTRRRAVYGERVSVDAAIRGPMSDEDLAAKIAQLLAAGQVTGEALGLGTAADGEHPVRE